MQKVNNPSQWAKGFHDGRKSVQSEIKGWISKFDHKNVLMWCGIIWGDTDGVLTIERINYVEALAIWGSGFRMDETSSAIRIENIMEVQKDEEGLRVYKDQLSCMRDFAEFCNRKGSA